LAICGWAKSDDELESELSTLENQGFFTRAAARALFNGLPDRAIQALSKGDEKMQLMTLAIAGYQARMGRQNSDDASWKALCSNISNSLTDSYSRAMYALVSDGNWESVVNETSLPLRDRVGVALRVFPDRKLTKYLDKITKEAIETGDIEGIVLTGITDKTMDLFQRYIEKFNDTQTAVLVMSFANPVYISDYRFTHWRDSYRDAMDSWKMHVKRCLYETQHTRKARMRDGTSMIKPPPRQISLRCNYCDSPLINDKENAMGEPLVPSVLGGPSVNTGICCPTCGKHLPRCAVCLQYLGMPRASRPAQVIDEKEDPLAKLINFCLKCSHGFHADHSRTWFSKHKMCPVPECTCLCSQ
jgi:hypothetical protein